MENHGGDESPHVPSPTLWPVGFAVGIVCILVGLVITNWVIVGVGALVTAVFAFLWIRDVTVGHRSAPAPPPPEPPLVPARTDGPPMPEPGEGEVVRFPRNKLLEGATLGFGAVIGGIVTLPILGFAALPPFIDQDHPEIDVGSIDDFPENRFVITTFLLNPKQGEVSRRTAYIRYNGFLNGDEISFTVLSNRCVHLGCPVQVNGLALTAKNVKTPGDLEVTQIPTAAAAGFGCPCHGGQYDTEGNPTAGPPVRALDRYEFRVKNGRLLIGDTFSVSKVYDTGADAKIVAYGITGPGQHVDGPEALLYPVQPPR